MDAILQFMIEWGYLGMFLSALIAGTVVPFSSEAVLVACISMGLNPVGCVLAATAGNMIGGMTCYWLGTLGNMKWIEKYFGVDQKKLERAERFVKGRGAWMAFFMFIPFFGGSDWSRSWTDACQCMDYFPIHVPWKIFPIHRYCCYGIGTDYFI